ncbi:MAG: hypothetical protein M0Z50_06415 [Planctomycetia bacterium]|nr:hypothetical protein [Planctomycetia bacterium]
MTPTSMSYQSEMDGMCHPIVSLGLAQVLPFAQSASIRPDLPSQSYLPSVAGYVGAGDVRIGTRVIALGGGLYAAAGQAYAIGGQEASATERDPWLEKFEELLNSFPQVSHQVDSSRKYIY